MAKLRLRFGNYTHPDAEAEVAILREAVFGETGEINGIQETWNITGRLEADTQAALTTSIQALEAAYTKQVDEISLEFADTGNDTAHSMKTSEMRTPIEVVQPVSYPIGSGAQYAGFRDYQIVVRGTKNTTTGAQNASQGLVQWEETIEVSGGYPRDVLVTTINTIPIRQRVAEYTPCIIRQFGTAASTMGWPLRPATMFDLNTQAVLLDNSFQKHGEQVTLANGVKKGQLFAVTWSYAYALQLYFVPAGPRRPLYMPVSQY